MAYSIETGPAPHPGTYWVVDGLLLAGAFPGHPDPDILRRRITGLSAIGIERFLNLMEPDERDHEGRPFSDYTGFAESLGARCERHPIRDRGIPDQGTMDGLLDSIDRSLANQHPVYLHCWGGIGRTGTAVGCWLVRQGLADADDVFSTLDALRSRDPERGHRPSPETAAQRDFVTEWARHRPSR